MINVRNLTYRYPGNPDLTLKGLNFSIDQGEIFGFLGPSGAGKTTTQKILIGILKKYGGHITVMGRELSTMKSDYYETIGASFEFPNLFTRFTALENLTFFKRLYSVETVAPMKLLKMVGLDADANTRVSDFSKGMKMRLNFCRSLLNNPKLIFLDEPTSGLDPVNLTKIKNIILAEKANGKTICITTHDMHVADSLCDRVAFIVGGEIALIDSPRNLKLQHGKRTVRVEYRENSSFKQVNFELENLHANADFQTIIKDKYIETIHTQEATLDDIFIKTTGKSLL
ncbi:ABC transporter ATP-binding protein [candidate division KSB1 bacterium]|nr:ABC transporter ATP-binding protein [candidate division KSB1 bacterium]